MLKYGSQATRGTEGGRRTLWFSAAERGAADCRQASANRVEEHARVLRNLLNMAHCCLHLRLVAIRKRSETRTLFARPRREMRPINQGLTTKRQRTAALQNLA